MVRTVWVALIAAVSAASDGAPSHYEVTADGIVAGNARFQPLGDRLLRMEYSSTGKFVDTPTAVVANRLRPSKAKVTEVDGRLVVETARYRLEYRLGSGPFTRSNLRVVWSRGSWSPGQADPKNLGGAPSALDGATTEYLPSLGEGVLSRAGYWLLDDSATPVFDRAVKWITERAKPLGTDQYLFVYGTDFKGALNEYARLLGAVPMIPRFALGCWYSRYWDYTDQELKDVVDGFRSRNMPLDVLVVDVDWHKYGWEGYDWNTKSFPDPNGFLKWCHSQGLEVTLNNHPSLIPAEDSHAPAVRRMLGLPQNGEGYRFNLAVEKDAEAYNKVLHDPFLDDGVSFWWIDGNSAYMDGLNSQLWTNRVYYDGQEDYTGMRSFIYSRYGGIGSHRYPLGFSGDTIAGWDVLQYEAGMTATAGNVLWQWSHDIGGFHGDKIPDQLMARWTQFGVFSPVLRLHSNHGERRPWAYGPTVERVMGEAMRLRERLIPFLYSLQHEFVERNVPVQRPVYFEEPTNAIAYQHPYQFLVGRDLLVAPACAPTKDGVTDVPVYLPKGKWLNFFTGAVYDGGRSLLFPARLEDTPVFARAGAIVPTQPDKLWDAEPGVAGPMTIRVYRGANGSFELVEDDGVSLDYRKGLVARTRLDLQDAKDGFVFTIGARQGTYSGAPAERAFDLLVYGATKPMRVTTNGVAGVATMESDGALRISLGTRSAGESVKVEVDDPGGFGAYAFAGRARAMADRLAAIPVGNGSAAGRILDDFVGKLQKDAGEVDAGTRKPDSLGNRLLRLCAELRSSGARDALVAQVVDFRFSGGVELAEPFGFRDTISAYASWDPNLPASDVSVSFEGPQGFRTKRVSPEEPGFARWQISEIPGTPSAAFEAALKWSAGKGDLQVSKTRTFRWSDSFVRIWEVLGPLPGSLPTSDGVVPAAGALDLTRPVDTPAGKLRWMDLPRAALPWKLMQPRIIDLKKVWDREQCHAFAATYLYSPTERDARFDLGSDDTFALWLNGKQMARSDAMRPFVAGDNKVPVHLKKGWNEVVVCVGNGGGQWSFAMEVCTPDGAPDPDVKQSTTPGR